MNKSEFLGLNLTDMSTDGNMHFDFDVDLNHNWNILDKHLKDLKENGGESGFNLFDTKVSDHILEGDEALGWALQGTYVTKTDYPDAYNKILNKYNDPNNTIEPLAQMYKTVGSPVYSSISGYLSGISTTDYAYMDTAVPADWDLNITTEIRLNGIGAHTAISHRKTSNFIATTAEGYITFDITMSDSSVITATGSKPLSTNTKYKAVFERTNGEFKLSVYNNTDLYDTISAPVDSSLRIGTDNYAVYYIGVDKDISTSFNGYINISKTEFNIGNSNYPCTINAYVNSNKWRIYDTTCKSCVDTIYTNTGIADYYGVDLVNERIFLPRDKYFAVTGDVAVAGNGMALGLTNGSSLEGLGFSADGIVVHRTGNYGTNVGSTNSGSGATTDSAGITTDPDLSGIEGQLTPNENKYLYYCVGNTKVESAISNVTEITTSENDTLPLFHNFYSKEDMTTTGAYVNASLGTYLSGNVYTTAYNELVKKLGTGNVKANTDTYTDYDFVLNQDDMTFRLPIKNGQEVMFATGVKGNGTALGLTNGSTYAATTMRADGDGNYSSLRLTTTAYGSDISTTAQNASTNIGGIYGVTTDSTKSGIELDTENITIPDGWNLYYKVANAVTNLELLDVAKVMDEAVLKSTLEEVQVIVESYSNGLSGCNVYSNRYCEQWGRSAEGVITLLKTYKDTNYNILVSGYWSGNVGGDYETAITEVTTTSFTITLDPTASQSSASAYWKTCGYIS